MSDRTEIEKILREAGLQEHAIQECLTIFEKERITSTVLPQLSVEDLLHMGIVTGDRRLLFNHLHPNSTFAQGASAPPPPEAVPLCEQHHQPISGMCTEQGCQLLVCNDCASVGVHRTHKVVDSQKGVDLLRSHLKNRPPLNALAGRLQTQRNKVATLRSQLAEEEQELKKMEQEEQEQATMRARISQSLSQTENLPVGPDTLNALKQLHQLVTSLGENFCLVGKIQFTEVIGKSPEHIQVTESGRKLRFVGKAEAFHVGVIDPTPITSGDGVVEWAVLPKSNNADARWVGCGVIPVSDVSKLQTTKTYQLLHGWSTNSVEWRGEGGSRSHPAAKDNHIMRLRLDCEKATLTLNGGAAGIHVPFPVYCFVALCCPNNELSVVD
eukprot:TRINITY_DN68009_c0_g1_i4.p1 TRINITY_DN68009_c0_g1~~TRINITY_DN68009_c0_g1_i4.p1  ORF type:complete len:383 (+),score=44.85 TRINITY_DN68009_c0_g1_i4:51-1199(+)